MLECLNELSNFSTESISIFVAQCIGLSYFLYECGTLYGVCVLWCLSVLYSWTSCLFLLIGFETENLLVFLHLQMHWVIFPLSKKKAYYFSNICDTVDSCKGHRCAELYSAEQQAYQDNVFSS